MLDVGSNIILETQRINKFVPKIKGFVIKDMVVLVYHWLS